MAMSGWTLSTRTQSYIAITLWGAAFVLGNLAVMDSTHRWDFTKDQKHTLSETSLGILSDAESAIEVRAFIPTDLPPQEMELADAIRDALSDYRAKAQVPLVSSSSTLQTRPIGGPSRRTHGRS